MCSQNHVDDVLVGTTFGKLLTRLKNAPRITEIRHWQAPVPRTIFSHYAGKSIPFVFRGLVSAKLADIYEATLSLASAAGDQIVTGRYGNYADPAHYVGNRLERSVTIGDYLYMVQNTITGSEQLYIANQPIASAVLRQMGVLPPPYYSCNELRHPRLWIGPPNSATPLHKDGSDNFISQIFGTKRWVLFPVRDYPSLYMNQPSPNSFPGFATSKVDIRKPDCKRYSQFRNAVGLELDVTAGETLYLPAGWSHYVENLTVSMSVNYWVDNRRRLPAFLESF